MDPAVSGLNVIMFDMVEGLEPDLVDLDFVTWLRSVLNVLRSGSGHATCGSGSFLFYFGHCHIGSSNCMDVAVGCSDKVVLDLVNLHLDLLG